MKNPGRFALAIAFLGLNASALADPPPPNTLTTAEKSAGWQLLFDGQTFTGWRGYGLKGLPEAGWEIKDGLLKTIPKVKGVALITEKKFTNFDLSWEWRAALGANNGVKYFVTEERAKSPGHEYQTIDDERHPDARRGPLYQTGAFYDVFPPAADKPSKPAGEWNSSSVVVRGDHVEHWLNGKLVLAYDAGSAAVKAAVAKSKFAKDAGFGDKITGPIMLTYHQDEFWYRNIKIRELP